MRRTTLGPIQNNAAMYGTARGARASMGGGTGRMSFGGGPSRMGPPKAKGAAAGAGAAGAGRHSYAPVSKPRRSSGAAAASRRSTAGGRHIKSDPRPLADKAYQNQGIRALIKYLSEHAYDNPISPKILTHPTSKDFVNIVSFLFRQVDPHFKFSGPVENEIPIIFKGLRYPFGISKTGLTAVGSPHTWPALLGSLTWLIELLTYDETVQVADESEGLGGDGNNKLFFNYLGEAYHSFLNEDDELFAALDTELEENFAKRNEAILEDTKSYQEQIEAVNEEIAKLTATESTLPGLKTKKTDYESDFEKFTKLIAQLEAHKANLLRKQGEREEELAAERERLAEAQADVARLQHRVDTQEVSAADAEHMAQERARLRESLDATAAAKEAAQNDLFEMEQALAKSTDALNARVSEYSTMATQLQVLPRTAKHARGIDFDIHIVKDPAEGGDGAGDSLLSADVKGVIKPALRELKSVFTQKMHEIRAQSLETSESVAVAEEAVEEHERVIEHRETQLHKLEETFKKEKEALEAHLSAHRGDVEAIEEQIDELQGVARAEQSNGREFTKESNDVLEAEVAAEIKSNEFARRELQAQIITAMDQLTAHKHYIQERLESLQAKLDNRVYELQMADRFVAPPAPAPAAPAPAPVVEAEA